MRCSHSNHALSRFRLDVLLELVPIPEDPYAEEDVLAAEAFMERQKVRHPTLRIPWNQRRYYGLQRKLNR